jgi:Ca-activated chloride channel family protein
MDTQRNKSQHSEAPLSLHIHFEARAERHLLRLGGSRRHLYFHILVEQAANEVQRKPLRLALVLDRSGSMGGEKIRTARNAALAVIERLNEQDEVAVVIFDQQVEVLQPLTPATTSLKKQIWQKLMAVHPRGQTALHQGWLKGCEVIAPEAASPTALAHCFLLTDGLANVGETDVERIAADAAGIHEHAGIATSTFGIGSGYNELLLGPMAVAGCGQFHHLRNADEIMSTFIGELTELFATAISHTRIELEVSSSNTHLEAISAYWLYTTGKSHWSLPIGGLRSGEERHIVVRLDFPPYISPPLASIRPFAPLVIRARLVWMANGTQQQTAWQEIPFSYASDEACNAERNQRDSVVMHWAALHYANLVQREAIMLNQQGYLTRARQRLQQGIQRITEYAGNDPEVQEQMKELLKMHNELHAPLSSMAAKEYWYIQQTRSRGQRDYRGYSDQGEDQKSHQ